jgi:hypothetical protein
MPAASKRLESNLKKEQDKVIKLLDMNVKVKLDLQAAKLSVRNLKEKHTNALAKKDNGEYFMIHCSTIRRATHHLLHLDFDKIKQRLQMEIDELSRNLENKKKSQKATTEKLKEAKKSCEALKKELEGLNAKEYGTKLEVMLICEKAAAAERVAAS